MRLYGFFIAAALSAVAFVLGGCSGGGGTSTLEVGGTPLITGTVEVGSTLTADIDGVTGSGEALIVWQRVQGEGSDWLDRAEGTSYEVMQGDVGHRFRLLVSRVGYAGSVESQPSVVVPAPVMPGTVTITMDADVIARGVELTAVTSGTPADATFRWQRGEGEEGAFADIVPPETANTYTVTADDRGFRIRVALDHAGFAGIYSAPTDVMQEIGSVAIVGFPLVGEPLTLDTAGLFGTGALTYRWYRGSGANFEVIAGQTGAAFTPRSEDVGYLIRVEVERADIDGVASDTSNGAVFIPFREVAAGASHTLAIAEDGSLWAWGNNNQGRLGIGNVSVGANVLTPTRVGTETDWVMVSAGHLTSIGIRGVRNLDGSVRGRLWVWGGSVHGGLGDGQSGFSTVFETAPIQVAGEHDDWVYVSIGFAHVAAIRDEGAAGRTLWTWGMTQHSRLGLIGVVIPSELPHPHPTQVPVGDDWVQVSAGESHTVGIREDGSGNRTLWAWGGRTIAIPGLGTTPEVAGPQQIGSYTDWESVSAGERHTIAIRRDGTLWAWGHNIWGITGQGTADGTTATPTRVGTYSDWVAVSAGFANSVAIREEGGSRTLWAWGSGERFRTGLDSAEDTLVPMRVGAFTDWERLGSMANFSSVHEHGVAIRRGGTLWAWGGNSNGQTGVAGVPPGVPGGNPGGTVPSPSRVFPLR